MSRGGVRLGTNSKLISVHKISFGKNVEFSWDCQVIDSDFHFTQDINTKQYNQRSKPVIIGNNVWIGNHVTISKGAVIPDNSIVSTHSFVNKKFEGEYLVIGGMPARILKIGIKRIFDENEEKRLIEMFKAISC